MARKGRLYLPASQVYIKSGYGKAAQGITCKPGRSNLVQERLLTLPVSSVVLERLHILSASQTEVRSR